MVDIEDVGVREVLKHMEKYSSEKNQTINKFMLTQVGRAEYCTVNTFVEQKYETRKPRVMPGSRRKTDLRKCYTFQYSANRP